MPRNRVQHQKGLSDDGFEQRYPDEEACRKASRWCTDNPKFERRSVTFAGQLVGRWEWRIVGRMAVLMPER
jgi:hypothetical protein